MRFKPRKRHGHVESLEQRCCLSSVGWDGPGRGSAELTYYVGTAPAGVNQATFESAVEEALAAWSEVIDVEFTETAVPDLPDSIDLEFGQIDGSYGTLAQAWFPDDVNPARIAGDVLFDASENWEVGNADPNAFDLTLVAAHEIGHALGIGHLPSDDAVLHDSVTSAAYFTGLSEHDVDAALALYAPASADPVPAPLAPTDTTQVQVPNVIPTALPDTLHQFPNTQPKGSGESDDSGPTPEDAERPIENGERDPVDRRAGRWRLDNWRTRTWESPTGEPQFRWWIRRVQRRWVPLQLTVFHARIPQGSAVQADSPLDGLFGVLRHIRSVSRQRV